MKVVGLISGGKDSIWNLHYCAHLGHEIVCLANLAPPTGVSEMDSYMYQTVGHDLIDAVAEAMGLPLVRRTIAGVPDDAETNSYTPKEGDEVEDLLLLLQDVKKSYPDVQAVSCGAILSNYQRIRVENVCQRLGLQALAFMWQQKQEVLLQQMIEGNIDARIAKVASLGLDSRHVGKSILDRAFTNYLFKIGAQWQVNVCGEGGEYETTVVDSPLFRRSINMLESEIVKHDGPDCYFLQAPKVETIPKDDQASPPFDVLEPYTNLAYYQENYPLLLPANQESTDCSDRSITLPSLSPINTDALPANRPSLHRIGPVLTSSSLDIASLALDAEGSPAVQCGAVLQATSSWLESLGRSLADAVYVEVQVRDLSCFVSMNAVYATFFVHEPPARVCIETLLPEGMHLRLRLSLRDRNQQATSALASLRVQSISTWAMACIGPYSQAHKIGGHLLSAGVLGLTPHSMVFPSVAQASAASASSDSTATELTEPWQAELWLLMRSLQNVLKEMKSSFKAVVFANVYTTRERDLETVKQSVLAYMARGTAAKIRPLINCAVVPRLPKDGQIEINLVCEAKCPSALNTVAAALPDGVDTPVKGSVTIFAKPVSSSSCVISAEFLCTDKKSEVRTFSGAEAMHVCSFCLTAVKSELDQLSSSVLGLNVLVQYVPDTIDHTTVESSVQSSLTSLQLGDVSVAGYMPVLFLGEGVPIRVIAIASSDQASQGGY